MFQWFKQKFSSSNSKKREISNTAEASVSVIEQTPQVEPIKPHHVRSFSSEDILRKEKSKSLSLSAAAKSESSLAISTSPSTSARLHQHWIERELYDKTIVGNYGNQVVDRNPKEDQ